MKVIVAGAGEVGFNIADKLSKEKADVVLIENNPVRLTAIADLIDVQCLQGSASNPLILKKAGIEEADIFVAVTSSDESNILSCSLARLLAPDVRRAARVRDPLLYKTLIEDSLTEGLGLNYLVDPTGLTVDTILDFLSLPGAVDVIDVADGKLKFVGVRLAKNHRAVGKTLAEVLPRTEGSVLLVVAIYRQHQVLIPTGATVLRAKDLLYLAATPAHLTDLGKFFELEFRPASTVFIMGGGEVGLGLARRLEERNLTVKLVEQNQERCEYLSQELAKTIVLQGDATDQGLLEDEGINDCDVFIAVGTDDEKNMVSCLLAKRLGAANTITRVNRFSYVPLVSAIGLESLVSARVAATSAILKYVRKGLVVTVATLQNEDAEVVEIVVPLTSKMVGCSLQNLKIPSGSIIGAILRDGEAIIPRGDTVIEAEDTLAVVARSEVVSQITKAVT
ncbi:MAG: Trk system potassium transporter TrkA [Deltaproteobacteria bacterium]|jgi:trk system potassium uptake protein TrkA|nr:Trk system potassium transporter TrkA [Deltaproteobacteria bacterium]